jgi:hypothetical protein
MRSQADAPKAARPKRRADAPKAARPKRRADAPRAIRQITAIALLLSWQRAAMAADATPESVPPASADATKTQGEVLLLPTAIVGSSDAAIGSKPLGREPQSMARARQLDLTLSDAAQDLGFTLDLSERADQDARELSDIEVLERAAKGTRWVVYPSIDTKTSDPILRLVAVAPGSKIMVVRTESVKPADLAIRAVIMLRDVMVGRAAPSSEVNRRPSDHVETQPALAIPARSQGRSVLALNSAFFGGFIGYSVQRGSGSDDQRLLFPLIALGTGLGLGASTIVAEEWDVGLGDAWYLSAAAWWPALSGLFLARSRTDADPSTEYSFALIGSLSGLGLATTSLALGGGMSQGGALLTHSGGAFGTLLGAMTELAVRGEASLVNPPNRGIGYGAGIGVVLAGAAAVRNDIEPARVQAIDLGAGLGGLAGAAVTSPFIFRQRSVAGDRAFLATTMGFTLAGGAAAYWFTRKPAPAKSAAPAVVPVAGPIGESVAPSGARAPVMGLAVSGILP